jgi:hypothetical protein
LIGPPVLAIVHWKSGSDDVWHCRETKVVPQHAWPRVVVDEEAHVPTVLVNHSTEHDGALHLLVC